MFFDLEAGPFIQAPGAFISHLDRELHTLNPKGLTGAENRERESMTDSTTFMIRVDEDAESPHGTAAGFPNHDEADSADSAPISSYEGHDERRERDACEEQQQAWARRRAEQDATKEATQREGLSAEEPRVEISLRLRGKCVVGPMDASLLRRSKLRYLYRRGFIRLSGAHCRTDDVGRPS